MNDEINLLLEEANRLLANIEKEIEQLQLLLARLKELTNGRVH